MNKEPNKEPSEEPNKTPSEGEARVLSDDELKGIVGGMEEAMAIEAVRATGGANWM